MNIRIDHQDCRADRRAMTLVELLVVISILLVLAVVALPAMQPAVESRRIREAARSVNVFLATARNQAAATGRPCGVIIQRSEGLPQAGIALYQAEVPPPYAGNTTNTTVSLVVTSESTVGSKTQFTLTANISHDLDTSLIQVGDRLQVNHQGPWYEITDITDATTLNLQLTLDAGAMLPWPSGPGGSPDLPFQIRRQPVKSGTRPLLLPATTAIDLEFSGTDSDFFNDTNPVAIMFSPNGNVVDSSYYLGVAHAVTEPIYLLVGKLQQVDADPNVRTDSDEETWPNWQVLTNLWIMISPQSGQATVGEVAMVDPIFLDKTTNYNAAFINQSRSIVSEGQSMGGR